MKRALFGLVMLVGCMPELPDGVPLENAQPAAEAVLKLWGIEGMAPPPVFGVVTDCAFPSGTPGFINPNTGKCVGGTQDPYRDRAIFLPVYEGAAYSTSLPHEMAHFVYDDPDHALQADNAGPWIQMGRAALHAQPELDTIRVR